MIIDAISDTHNRHKHIQGLGGGQIIIHAGDATSRGLSDETEKFLAWFGGLDYTHRIFVPGNHDWLFERDPVRARQLCARYDITLLIDEAVTIEGIKIYGSPWQPWFHDWAFNAIRGEDIKKHWDKIPEDTHILVTHGPAAGILDVVPYANGTPKERVGCVDLLNRIAELPKLRAHVCGHIHHSHGHMRVGAVDHYNVSICDEGYYPANSVTRIVCT